MDLLFFIVIAVIALIVSVNSFEVDRDPSVMEVVSTLSEELTGKSDKIDVSLTKEEDNAVLDMLNIEQQPTIDLNKY